MTDDELARLKEMREQGYSLSAMARSLGYARATISGHIKAMGLPPRAPGAPAAVTAYDAWSLSPKGRAPRKVPSGPRVPKHRLTLDMVRALLNYNEMTGKLYWWSDGTEAGSVHPTRGYRWISLRGEAYRAAHLVWFCAHGRWPAKGRQLNNLNGNKDDNRLANLVEVRRGYATKKGASEIFTLPTSAISAMRPTD
jgi:HNH endonuclease